MYENIYNGGIVRNRSYLIIFTIILISLSTIYAMPPGPGVKLSATDAETRAQLGIDIIKNPVRDIGKRGIFNTPGDVQPLVSGTKKFPVVCIKYTDYTNTYGTTSFDSMLFSDNWSSGSAKKYYNDVSYGVFTLQGNTVGWVTSDNVQSWYGYGADPTMVRAAMLAKEAAQKADASIDYSQYDNDHDGYVDVFTCLHAGYGAEEGSNTNIWSHSWDFTSAGIGVYTTSDPDPINGGYIKINDYVMDPERSNYSNHGTMVCIGVFCHEWGHALGLPDLYNTGTAAAGEGLGLWSLMAAGSWGGDYSSPWYPAQMDAWAKLDLGWLNPTAVRSRNLYSIPKVETNSKDFWLMARQRTFKEYYLVENRQKTLSDTTLRNSGLLIYHIDDSVIGRRRGSNAVNNGGTGWKYGVALEQADGQDSLYLGNVGDAGDPYPGSTNNTRFDSSTTPNSKTNYPSSSQLITSCLVKNIPTSSATMACTLASGAVGQFTGGPDASSYKWIDSDTSGGPAYSWIDISGTGTALGTGDDARYSFSLPFNFNFYGTNYTTVWVCTNGWLSFGSDPGTNASSNTSIPAASIPNQAVFAFWDNLNLVASDNANIYYKNFGTTPNQYSVITWKDSRIVGVSTTYQVNQVTFQAILYENGKITLQYKDCAVGDTTYNWGRSASVGIENSTGLVGLQYLYNGSPIGNLLASERAIQFYPSIKDFGVTAIENPIGPIDSTSTTIIPRARIQNNGATIDTCSVTFKIGSIYSSTRTKILGGGIEDTVNFASWTPVRGTYLTRCSTYRLNDAVSSNDTLDGSVTIQVKDVGVTSIDNPSGTIDSSSASVFPIVHVKNFGTIPATFNVTFKIGSTYTNSRSKTLGAGIEDTVKFFAWTPVRGIFVMHCSTNLISDVVRTNDTLSAALTVRVKDVGVTAIEYPTGSIDSTSTTINPRASVKNFGTDSTTFQVTFKIGSIYTNSRSKKLDASAEDTVNFTAWTPVRGAYATRCSTYLLSDAVPGNDTLGGSVIVTVKNVGVTAIEYPTGSIDSSGTQVIPRARVRNYNSSPDTFTVTFKILGTSYTSTRSKILGAGIEDTVNFTSWTPVRGTYTTRCSIYFSSDVVSTNDTLSNSVIVQVKDVGVTSIDNPTGTIDSNSTSISPIAHVKNFGTNPATFNVTFNIGSIYTNSRSKTLGAGAEDTVNFLAWTPVRGTYSTHCSTYLLNDVVKTNDTLSGSVLVRVIDVGVTTIEYPTGSIDSTSSLIPRARVKNFGTNDTTFNVTFIIGSIYTDTRSKTLGAGNEDTVNFLAWQPIRGNYQTRCSTYLVNDAVSENDTLGGSFTVNVSDVGIAEIIQPTGIIDTNEAIIPQAKVMNYGNNPETFNVRFLISGPAKTVWSDDTTVTVNPVDSLAINFAPWTIGERGMYTTRCSTYLATDMDLSNNVLADSFTVQVKDYAVTLVSEPYNPVDSGSITYPKAIIHNYGSTNESNVPVVLYIVGTSYVDTQYVGLTAGDSIEKTFDGFTANVARGNYTIRCTTELNSDAVKENNLATREFAIRVADVGVIEIIQPINGIDSTGTAVIPKARVKNFGTHSENFNVMFTINGTAWSNTEEVSDLDAGAEQVVEFAPWPIGPRGDYIVRCSTELANDMYPENDTLGNSFTVIVDTIPPLPTTLISPSGNIYDNTPEFVWYDVSDVDSFNLVIIGPTKEIIDIMTAETTFTLSVPLSDSNYYWKVRGKDVSGNWSVYSDSFTFTILAPAIPTLVSPSDNNISNNQSPTFIWHTSVDADSFNLVYTGPAKSVTSVVTKDTTYIASVPLDDGVYNWKVRAKDEYGNYSDFSTEWTFTIDVTPPSVPVLIAPANSTILTTESLTMVWHSSIEAVLYNLVIGNDSVFLTDTVFATELPRGSYVWKVRAQDTVVNWSQFSLPWSFTIQIPAWTQQESMPTNIPGKYVKDGGALVAVNSSKTAEVYAFRGNKSKEFYKFNGVWTSMDTMPYGVKPTNPIKINKKQIGKGAAMCYDGVNTIYATKGNSTKEFWAYTISDSTWHVKAFVPVAKYLKGGTSLAYCSSRVYLLAGGQKKDPTVNNFWVYDPDADTTGGAPWTTRTSLTLGPNTKVWKDGASIVELDGTIYALKSNDKFNFFFAYNIEGNTWSERESLPVRDYVYGKVKKIYVKDGGATTSGQGTIYAIKGGGYNVFWKYTSIGGWTALESIPRLHKKSVPKTGAALVYAGDGKIYLLKGNNSSEFWKFNPPAEKLNVRNQISNINIQTENSIIGINNSLYILDVSPNPFLKNALVRYTVPAAGQVLIKLYNTTGRLIETLIDQYQNAGTYTLEIDNWKLKIAHGIYILKYDTGNSISQKVKIIVN